VNALSQAPVLNTPFAWLVRRELWENRYLWLVPLIVALAIFAAAVGGWVFLGHAALFHFDSDELETLHQMTVDQVRPFVSVALVTVAVPFLMIGVLGTQFFYALDSLYGDRRDRSILFYKSLPISDTATVLSKAAVATVGVLVITFIVSLLLQFLIAVLTSLELYRYPVLLAALWSPRVWGAVILLMAYMVVALSLWYLPLVGLWLLISARANRAPLMWAFLLVAGLLIAEGVGFRTHHVWDLFVQRVQFSAPIDVHVLGPALNRGLHGMPDAHAPLVSNVIAPLQYLASPQLWAGLVAAVMFLMLTIRLRKRAEASS
jgi:ABC-2 type transport system permease protein